MIPIDFAGSVLTTTTGTSVSYANLGLFIRLDPAVLVVYWSTNYDGFTLESADGSAGGPFVVVGDRAVFPRRPVFRVS